MFPKKKSAYNVANHSKLSIHDHCEKRSNSSMNVDKQTSYQSKRMKQQKSLSKQDLAQIMNHLERSARSAIDDIRLIGNGKGHKAESDVVFNWC